MKLFSKISEDSTLHAKGFDDDVIRMWMRLYLEYTKPRPTGSPVIGENLDVQYSNDEVEKMVKLCKAFTAVSISMPFQLRFVIHINYLFF